MSRVDPFSGINTVDCDSNVALRYRDFSARPSSLRFLGCCVDSAIMLPKWQKVFRRKWLPFDALIWAIRLTIASLHRHKKCFVDRVQALDVEHATNWNFRGGPLDANAVRVAANLRSTMSHRGAQIRNNILRKFWCELFGAVDVTFVHFYCSTSSRAFVFVPSHCRNDTVSVKFPRELESTDYFEYHFCCVAFLFDEEFLCMPGRRVHQKLQIHVAVVIGWGDRPCCMSWYCVERFYLFVFDLSKWLAS